MSITFNFNVQADIRLSLPPDQEILRRLDELLKGQIKIMATLKEAQDALQKIDAATTNAANGLNSLGSSLQNVAADIKNLAAQVQSAGGSAAVFDGLVSSAAKVDQIAVSIGQFAEFTAALASETEDPVPVDVPPPPPAGPPA